MIRATDKAKTDRLHSKALDIREGNAVGLWVPIMRHLALRGHHAAMIDLAAWFSQSNRLADFGSPADGFSAAGLYRRAWRHGNAYAAQHLAMGCFNRGDLRGYRHWLGHSARAGDADAKRELLRFEIRLPHANARKVRRLRPFARRDEVV
jgi:hypothetical protein